jgi:hypothetical protein
MGAEAEMRVVEDDGGVVVPCRADRHDAGRAGSSGRVVQRRCESEVAEVVGGELQLPSLPASAVQATS